MEDECSSLSWEFYYQKEGLEDLSHSLLYTTLELEATLVSAKEEITRRECELIHLNDALSRVIKESDEAQTMCQKLMLEKLELQQELLQHQRDSTISQSEDEVLLLQAQGGISRKQCHYSELVSSSSSDSDENNIGFSCGGGGSSSKLKAFYLAEKQKALPEKGKLLKAVVEAGPLLQTLLLAGPLPQWQHPPPQLDSNEIPPVVAISSPTPPQHSNNTSLNSFNKKRDLYPLSCEIPSSSKLRKVI